MAKPILIVRIPLKHKDSLQETIKAFSENPVNYEYHILFVLDELSDTPVFECYNADNVPEANIESLKDRLTIFMESALYRIKEMKRQQEEELKEQREKQEKQEKQIDDAVKKKLEEYKKKYKPRPYQPYKQQDPYKQDPNVTPWGDYWNKWKEKNNTKLEDYGFYKDSLNSEKTK